MLHHVKAEAVDKKPQISSHASTSRQNPVDPRRRPTGNVSQPETSSGIASVGVGGLQALLEQEVRQKMGHEREMFRRERNQFRTENEQLRTENERLFTENKQFRTEIQALTADNDQRGLELRQAQEATDNMKVVCLEIQAKMDTLRNKLENETSSIEELQASLKIVTTTSEEKYERLLDAFTKKNLEFAAYKAEMEKSHAPSLITSNSGPERRQRQSSKRTQSPGEPHNRQNPGTLPARPRLDNSRSNSSTNTISLMDRIGSSAQPSRTKTATRSSLTDRIK